MPPQRFKIQPRHAFLAALAYLALNFVSAPLSILYGSALSAYLIWQARPEFLPALVLLQTDKANFVLGGYGSYDYAVERFHSGSLVIAGIPFTITYVIAAAVFLRVFWELVQNPSTFKRSGLIWLFAPWGIGLIMAAIMTFQAFQIRNPSWTVNIRLYMLLGCLFYGAILVRSWRGSGLWLIQWLVPMLGVFYFLAIFGRFHHQFLWVFTGMAVPLSWLALRQHSIFRKLTGVFTGFAVLIYGSGLGPGISDQNEIAGGMLGTGSSTFTLNALVLMSIVVAVVAALPKGGFRKFVAWFLGLPAFLTILIFSVSVAILSPKYTQIGSAGWNLSHSKMTPVERFQSKLFDDRSIIWNGMLKDALEKDYVLRPAGSVVFIQHPRHGFVPWQPGAHNSFLEAIRAHRWIGGPIVILFIFITMYRSAQVIGKPVPASLRGTAAGIIAVSIIANTAGSSPISGEGAFWYFTFSGIIIAAVAEVKHRAKAGAPALGAEETMIPHR